MSHHRKLGTALSEPIDFLANSGYDSACLIERDNKSAIKTRAAALMYMKRHNIDYTTSVKDNRVYIYQVKDVQRAMLFRDLR